MPTDWPLLAGGPADPADGTDASGTAESFRPYYDLMIAPNNAKNLALAGPDGGVLMCNLVLDRRVRPGLP